MSWFQQPAMRSPRINRHLLPAHTGSIATGVAAGSGHSLVATEAAGMFGLGSNKWWQLGVERTDNFSLPQPVCCTSPAMPHNRPTVVSFCYPCLAPCALEAVAGAYISSAARCQSTLLFPNVISTDALPAIFTNGPHCKSLEQHTVGLMTSQLREHATETAAFERQDSFPWTRTAHLMGRHPRSQWRNLKFLTLSETYRDTRSVFDQISITRWSACRCRVRPRSGCQPAVPPSPRPWTPPAPCTSGARTQATMESCRRASGSSCARPQPSPGARLRP